MAGHVERLLGFVIFLLEKDGFFETNELMLVLFELVEERRSQSAVGWYL